MKFFDRMLARPRIRAARQLLTEDPSARNYLALANEHARTGEMDEVERVCAEALELHTGHTELSRLHDRARALRREDRTRELARELRDSPRPGLYRELCEILLESGRVERAEECALEWFAATSDAQAMLVRAQARLQRFLSDRRRDDARLVCELLDTAEKTLVHDPRPLRMRLQLYTAVGAWRDARRIVSQLLEIDPGDPALEARFRTLNTMAERAPSFDAALREVERSGRLADEVGDRGGEVATSSTTIRPRLQALAAEDGVEAALFQRGATALVQGQKGATAERTARAVREVVAKSQTAARRLGLGHAQQIELEGSFGRLTVQPNEVGYAALWSAGPVSERHRTQLAELIGASENEEVEP
jgi:tetratricopeptide (TPR) repeat protein